MTIESLLTEASQIKASDLHLVAGKPPLVRIDGELKELSYPILTNKKIDELLKPLLSDKMRSQFMAARELDSSYQIGDGTRFRINLHFEKDNAGLVARVIPTTIPTLEDIGMPPIIYNLTRLDYGLIMVTGPTGCGKSTTLASIINQINSERAVNIITLEDPIEFIFLPQKSIIKQRQLGTDTLSFAEGLKHTLRQDPNVIMVGEMRDIETIAVTITLAETGHLVFATLHTNNAAETLDRIIDVFPPYQQNQIKMQLSSTLRAIISQRLLPKVGGGRIAAREILINNPAVANLIRENKVAQIKSVIQTGAEQGMITMDHHIRELWRSGQITKETAEAHVTSVEVLR